MLVCHLRVYSALLLFTLFEMLMPIFITHRLDHLIRITGTVNLISVFEVQKTSSLGFEPRSYPIWGFHDFLKPFQGQNAEIGKALGSWQLSDVINTVLWSVIQSITLLPCQHKCGNRIHVLSVRNFADDVSRGHDGIRIDGTRGRGSTIIVASGPWKSSCLHAL